MIADFVKDTALWFLREYGAFIAMGIVALLAAGAALGSIKSLLGSLFTLAFKAGDELSKKAATNRPLIVVAALGLAAFLWFRPAIQPKREVLGSLSVPGAVEVQVEPERSPLSQWIFGSKPSRTFDVQCPNSTCGSHTIYEESERHKTATCNKCGLDIGRIGAVAESRAPAAGEIVPAACRFCNARYPLMKGDGIGKAFTCRRCNKAQYICEAQLAYEATKGQAISISKGDWLSFQCLKCGATCGGFQDADHGDLMDVECGRCGHPNPVTSDKMFRHTARELEERRALVSHGVLSPNGFYFGEQQLFDEFLKTQSLGPGDRYSRRRPGVEQRERWNAYQRSLPEKSKCFLNRDGTYGELEPSSATETERVADSLEQRMEAERMALSEAGIMTPTLWSSKEESAYRAFDAKKLQVGFPGWEVQENRQIAAINRWNEFQLSVPEDRRRFLEKNHTRTDRHPGKFKMIPVNDEERLDASVASARVTLACYEILFPDATPEEKGVYNSLFNPENAGLLSKFRGNKKAREEYFHIWNDYQDKLNPTKRTFYLTKDGKLTKKSP